MARLSVFLGLLLLSLPFLLYSLSCGFEADWSHETLLGLSVAPVEMAKFSGATFSNIQLITIKGQSYWFIFRK